MLYEYARLTRTLLITVNNDAKSCYDRIIKLLAMIACIAMGLPLMAAAMTPEEWTQAAKYFAAIKYIPKNKVIPTHADIDDADETMLGHLHIAAVKVAKHHHADRQVNQNVATSTSE